MEITKEEANRLKESLSGITDERRQSGHLLHKLIDILAIGLTTVVAGWCEYSVMEDFGKAKLDFFKTFLELPHGIPDEKTFSRLFSRINPIELAVCLGHWLEEVREAGGREINIDGKAICGSVCKGKKAVHIVSAWVGAENLVLGQVATEEKSNEITAIPELLDTLEVTGDTITIDGMGCQREIAEKIREKGADCTFYSSGERKTPGFWQIDTVHHCGQSTIGHYVHTLTATDVASGWPELRSLLNNVHSWTFKALSDIRTTAPFPVLEFHR